VLVPSFGAIEWGLKSIVARGYDKARDVARRVHHLRRPRDRV
jgi:hypothetical protein